ncbi:MAG: hypothetical protein ACLGH8_03070 [Bacteroidia bacterium]
MKDVKMYIIGFIFTAIFTVAISFYITYGDHKDYLRSYSGVISRIDFAKNKISVNAGPKTRLEIFVLPKTHIIKKGADVTIEALSIGEKIEVVLDQHGRTGYPKKIIIGD